MQVQDVDIARLQLFQTSFEGHLHALRTVAREVGLNSVGLTPHVSAGELGGDDHLVAIVVVDHPLAQSPLGLAVLVPTSIEALASIILGNGTEAIVVSCRRQLALELTYPLAVSMKLPPAL